MNKKEKQKIETIKKKWYNLSIEGQTYFLQQIGIEAGSDFDVKE